jgi:alpha-amylase/alpha-mannosidase (GH57 family)
VNNQIISIRRNKYDRFLSLWKHIIDELHRVGKLDIADIFSKLTTNDIFDNITPNDIYNSENRYKVIDDFLTKLEILKEESYTKNMLDILFTPVVELTNNDPNIIWFDINNLGELENWVSKKLNREFKMEKINSSKHFNSVIEINDDFKEKYDNLYREFEERKTNKTII